MQLTCQLKILSQTFRSSCPNGYHNSQTTKLDRRFLFFFCILFSFTALFFYSLVSFFRFKKSREQVLIFARSYVSFRTDTFLINENIISTNFPQIKRLLRIINYGKIIPVVRSLEKHGYDSIF